MEDEASTSLEGKVLGNLRVVDLKQELEKRGLSKSGSKKDLIKRLKQQLELEKLYEERKSGDPVRKLELDAEIQQNEFVQQYLAQQQKRYAERQEKRLELEAMQKKENEVSVSGDEVQEKNEQAAVSDSDEENEKKHSVRSKPSNNGSQSESGEDLSRHTTELIKEERSHSNASETDNDQSCSSVPVSESVIVQQSDSISYSESKTEKVQNISESCTDVEGMENSQISLSSSLEKELSKSEKKEALSYENTPENTESMSLEPAQYISDDNKEESNSKPDNCEEFSDKIKNPHIYIHVSKDENDNETSSSVIYSSDTKIHSENTKCQDAEAPLSPKEDERNIDSSHTSEVASSSEYLPNNNVSENMETSQCSSVPYSLSEIQLPESPGQILKCKESKKDESNKLESPSKETDDKNLPLDNNDTHSNGNAAHDSLNSSHEEVISEPETIESKYKNDSPEDPSQRNDVRDSRQSDESSDSESDRNNSQYKKSSFTQEETSSNVAADSDESPSKDIVSKQRKSRQQSDESENEKSSDSEKYNHHSSQKRKLHGKHRERNRHSRSRSSSTSSSHSSDSAPEHRHSKKSVVSKTEDFTENDESNQMSEKNVDENSKIITKDNDAIESTHISSVSSKKRLKIKRDNVSVEITSLNTDSLKVATSSKTTEKAISHSTPDPPSKQESTETKEIIPEAPYTCRKLNLSNRKLNRKSSEDKNNEPKSKKSKWESFAACQKTSSTISISTDSLKNWFPDFKLMSEASSSMEIETDEQSSAVEEKSINVVHTDVSDGNETGMRRESISQIHIEESESMEPNYEDTSDQGPVSKIIFIQNLVRPFTLNQLKDLLKQSGKIVEEYFWIDKIKSKCFVMYETEKEAIRARNALNNTRWPSSNPKILSVEFSNEEELEQHKRGNEPPPHKPVLEPPVAEMTENVIETRITHPVDEHKRRDREHRKDRERTKHQVPVREWDKDKLMQDSPEKEYIPKEEKSRSSERKEKKESKKRPNEDTPAKLLDDLFQKTKNPPCIYWLPLTEEQAKAKEEAKKLRKLEREKRNQQLKEQEAERRGRRARSSRRSREKENRKSSTRSRSPVSRRR